MYGPICTTIETCPRCNSDSVTVSVHSPIDFCLANEEINDSRTSFQGIMPATNLMASTQAVWRTWGTPESIPYYPYCRDSLALWHITISYGLSRGFHLHPSTSICLGRLRTNLATRRS
ncbi:hypothetical protein K439DRAFT_1631747 [Ramaria rubella]|nr:hypothetical protein K439DRAFT_1631747 [Ramaria rubella]